MPARPLGRVGGQVISAVDVQFPPCGYIPRRRVAGCGGGGRLMCLLGPWAWRRQGLGGNETSQARNESPTPLLATWAGCSKGKNSPSRRRWPGVGKKPEELAPGGSPRTPQKIEKYRLPGGPARVPNPTTMECQRVPIPVFWAPNAHLLRPIGPGQSWSPVNLPWTRCIR
eukprot:gene12325-biopygen10984